MQILCALVAFLLLALVQATVPSNVKSQLTVDELVRIRCSHNPNEETYFFFNGTVTAYVGGDIGPSFTATTSIKSLFTAVGINVAKCYKSATGVWYLVGREAMWYIDSNDNILSSWSNFDGVSVDVVHVDNDPVMQTFNPAQVPYYPAQVIGSSTLLPSDVTTPLNYKNLIQTPPNSTFDPYSPQQYYQAAELFKFISPTAEVFSDQDSVDSTLVSWTRTSLYLPWMKMGNKSGYLLYSFQGSKIQDYTSLPAKIKADIEHRVPHYKHAPQSKCFPDLTGTGHSVTGGVTSWSFFKENFDSYLAGVTFPLATPRQYSCRTDAAYVPAAETQCKATIVATPASSWGSGSQTISQYLLTVNNIGTKKITDISVEIGFSTLYFSWGLVRVSNSDVYEFDLWNNIAVGGNITGYGVQVYGTPTFSIASITCA